MQVDIMTLFPDAVRASLAVSILGRAENKGIIKINTVQIRDFTHNKHNRWTITPMGAAGAA
jgi:tRNA (guanine37-N1)-methyltransferase